MVAVESADLENNNSGSGSGGSSGGGTGGGTGSTTNNPPTANAGNDQTVTELDASLNSTVVTLSGSGTDTDGTISSYSWTQISGPAVKYCE